MDKSQIFKATLLNSDYYKKCARCKEYKKKEKFSVQNKITGALKSYCKFCDRAYNQEKYLENKKQRLVQIKEWQNKNKDKVISYVKKYRDKI